MLFGFLVTFLAWFIASYILKRIGPTNIIRNRKELFSRDLFFLLIAGAGGGGLLYLLTQRFDPFQEGIVRECRPLVPLWALKTELYACFAAPAFLLVFLLGATLYIGVTSKSTAIDDEDREWWARLGAWILIAILEDRVHDDLIFAHWPVISSSWLRRSAEFLGTCCDSRQVHVRRRNRTARGRHTYAVMAKHFLLARVFIVSC